MRIGLGVLRLSPSAFWAMSLPELEAAWRGALGDFSHAAPMERGELEALMRRFPDDR